MKASLKNYRQSPRKVRLVADLVKGKSVPDALTTLSLLPKRAAGPVKKLIESAVANAAQKGIEKDNLTVENITVDEGIVLKRFRPRAFGRATMLRKRTSHIDVTLSAPEGVEVSAPADTADATDEETETPDTAPQESGDENTNDENDRKKASAQTSNLKPQT